jgi:hypothetical protein
MKPRGPATSREKSEWSGWLARPPNGSHDGYLDAPAGPVPIPGGLFFKGKLGMITFCGAGGCSGKSTRLSQAFWPCPCLVIGGRKGLQITLLTVYTDYGGTAYKAIIYLAEPLAT